MFAAVISDFNSFLHAPFRSNMDLFSVFLAIGAVIVAIFLWSRILAHLGVD